MDTATCPLCGAERPHICYGAHMKNAEDDIRSREAVVAARAGNFEQARATIARMHHSERRVKGLAWLAEWEAKVKEARNGQEGQQSLAAD